jgi:hypothetical protein
VYFIDNAALTWRRLTRSSQSGPLRTESGKLTEPASVALGRSTVLIGPPFAPGLGERLIITTRVTAILSGGSPVRQAA